jgi:hypothetical protein
MPMPVKLHGPVDDQTGQWILDTSQAERYSLTDI